ncbi:AAA domain-containing protein [Pseudomassariella vexata]|uniref:AAA domain-domain-containing protein n=1 Tax=Pseudomassariella vexata TaxID=1141098 RepID=A0A1Y2DER5_9PEZI|nr:AAA domain-containing protein [Pseudomassariella vexata]ORY57770.1 AAA domain-domain-containing protein [Pseudomassariella vexata]
MQSHAVSRGAQYSLDVSLFGCLVDAHHGTDPRIPFDTLDTQRVMHRSISKLIQSTLYPSIEDGGTAAQYPEVIGSYGSDDIAIITNYLGQLVRLRRAMEKLFETSVSEQDMEQIEARNADISADEYEASEPHKQPVVKKPLLKSIRLATVAKFQSEEAQVVVISLVRSKNGDECGFLSTDNRIDVLLSRAKHGIYLIGKAKTYDHVDM